MRRSFRLLLRLTFCVAFLALALSILVPGAVVAVEEGDFVCVRKWGIRANEGYCGRIEQLKTDREEVVIRITGGDGTMWRTKGSVCSEGLNIKRLRLGQTVQVPMSCLE